LPTERATQRVTAPAGAALVGELFAAGVTIAYDQNAVVPLPHDRSVALIYPASRPSIRTHCDAHPRLTWIGVAESPGAGDIARAVSASRNADIAVVFTINAGTNREQQQLVNALPVEKTVAVALFSPFDWTAFPGVSAYVTTYSPLPESVPAACGVLMGQIDGRGSLPVALDGARYFVNGGAQIGDGVALALVPRGSTSIPVTDNGTVIASVAPNTPVPTEMPQSLTPVPTLPAPTPTPTRVPLESGTRVAVLVPHLLSPTPDSTVVASLPNDVGSGDSVLIAEPSALAPPALIVTPEMLASLLPAMLVAGIGMTYGGVYVAAARSRSRFSGGFIIERCPCCGEYELRVKSSRRRVLGIPKARHTVRCELCGSVLRENGGGLWHYTVSAFANPGLHARFNDKTVDEKTLRLLEREKPNEKWLN
jgi:hypothetical protein